jgi:hypothetical protein
LDGELHEDKRAFLLELKTLGFETLDLPVEWKCGKA